MDRLKFRKNPSTPVTIIFEFDITAKSIGYYNISAGQWRDTRTVAKGGTISYIRFSDFLKSQLI